jgi:hypothetical protein
MRVFVLCLIIFLCAAIAPAQVRNQKPKTPPGMKTVEGKYHYLVHDLTDAEAAEVLMRMEAMVEEYSNRTREFSGRLGGKLPFLLFRDKKDYQAAGGMKGSGGMFDGEKLMAVAGEELNPGTWHVVQHEGFHQFAHAVIGGDMPTWVDEGLAEYFGEAVFTGDNFVSGVIPTYRRDRIVKMIESGEFKTVPQMMQMSLDTWNANLQVTNLRPGVRDGHVPWPRRRRQVPEGVRAVHRPAQPPHAVEERVAADVRQHRGLRGPHDGLLEEAARPAVAGRVRQRRDADARQPPRPRDRVEAGDRRRRRAEEGDRGGENQFPKGQELPPSLGKTCLDLLKQLDDKGATFELVTAGKNPQQSVVCRLKDGPTITATFKVAGKRVTEVKSKIEAKAEPKTERGKAK